AVDVLPADQPPEAAEAPGPRPLEPVPFRRRTPLVERAAPPRHDPVHIESFIGRRVLAWIAAALLVLAAAFFLNYALQSKMIGPAGQVGIAALFGTALCVWGFRQFARGGWILCQLLTGTGIFVLFLSVYAAFSVYPLLAPPA